MNVQTKTKATLRRRIKPPAQSAGKNRITLCLPEAMLDSIHTAMGAEGVSRKRRSRWIEKSVQQLFEMTGYDELILEEFIEHGHNKMIPVSLSVPVKDQVDKIVGKLSQEAEKPVDRSSLLRTAISQYLVRKVLSKGKATFNRQQ
jgi:hypothetical protein